MARTCPLCEAPLKLEIDNQSKKPLAVKCSTRDYDSVNNVFIGCDFFLPATAALLDNYSFKKSELEKLIDGDTLKIKGKKVYLNTENPTVKQDGNKKMTFYLKIEKDTLEEEF